MSGARPLVSHGELASAGPLRRGAGRIVRPLGDPAAEDEPPMRKSMLRDKVLESVTDAGRWLKRSEIAKAVGRSGPSVGNHLRQLETEGAIQAIGERRHKRYAALGVAAQSSDGANHTTPPQRAPKRRAPGARKARSKASRSPNLGELGVPPKPQLPALAEPSVTDTPRCAIEDTGLFAINDGKSTIRLSRKGIAKVVAFLELTQHVWKIVA